ncbi:MAG: molybdopterin-dependent oxidoreductase [Candidatus Hydrogenedens sp.]|nr:molybdopterin-dependent oxidoreductase [Candidatus Hydrogenedens sp.]
MSEKSSVAEPQVLPKKTGAEIETVVVGAPMVRKDAAAKALGTAVYAGDMYMPGMLIGKALRSRYPHARILSIDTAAAKSIPGVHAVLTARDVPGVNKFGLAIRDQEVLASEKVRMMGDAVALVAAETEDIALDALEAIRVDYEELPGVFSIEEALAEGAPLVHEDVPGNLLQHTMVRKGNIEEGFNKSFILLENTYMTQRVEHAYIEPETTLAYLDESSVMNVLTSTQYPFRDRRQIAPALGMPHNMVRVTQMTTGGGFGGKDDVTTEIQAALLALATRRAVRVTWTRAESMACSTKRHPMKIHVKTGCDREGMLQAMWGTVTSDKGAYCSIGHFITKKCGLHLAGPYYVPHVHVDTYAVYTNNTISGAFRGFGILQAAFVHESQMDQLAERAGISPLEIRVKNALRYGLSTATGQVFHESVGFGETLRCAEKYMQEQDLWG